MVDVTVEEAIDRLAARQWREETTDFLGVRIPFRYEDSTYTVDILKANIPGEKITALYVDEGEEDNLELEGRKRAFEQKAERELHSWDWTVNTTYPELNTEGIFDEEPLEDEIYSSPRFQNHRESALEELDGFFDVEILLEEYSPSDSESI